MKIKNWKFDTKELVVRLSRAEGQIRSVKKKLDEAHDPAAMLQQLAAARNAIDQVGRIAMLEYIKSDLGGAKDPTAKIEEYSELVKKYGW